MALAIGAMGGNRILLIQRKSANFFQHLFQERRSLSISERRKPPMGKWKFAEPANTPRSGRYTNQR